MKRFKLTLSDNPVFQTVTGLTNTTFDGTNVVESRGATEGQLLAVYNTYQEIKTFLDENGCNDDTYAYLRQKVNELETRIEQCCTVDHGEQDVSAIVARIDELEARIEECCNKSCIGGNTGSLTCDGNTITVSVLFNGPNPLVDGGKATAVSSMSDHNIVGYYFLVRNVQTGLYYKSATGKSSGDFGWSIGADGTMQASANTYAPYSNIIVAVDDHGCEGSIQVMLPGGNTAIP